MSSPLLRQSRSRSRKRRSQPRNQGADRDAAQCSKSKSARHRILWRKNHILRTDDRIARNDLTENLVASSGSILIHPYDNDRIIAGQGTAALELLEEVPDLDFIIAPVSGGGLLSGTSIASRGMRQQIRVIGGEPKNADDAFHSLRDGQPLPSIIPTRWPMDFAHRSRPAPSPFSAVW